MDKKIFDAPYLKVVEIKNDILTSSPTGTNPYESGAGLAPYRNIFSEELLDSEDFEEEY